MHSHASVIELFWLCQYCTNQSRGEIDRLIKCLSMILNHGKSFNFIWFVLIWWNLGEVAVSASWGQGAFRFACSPHVYMGCLRTGMWGLENWLWGVKRVWLFVSDSPGYTVHPTTNPTLKDVCKWLCETTNILLWWSDDGARSISSTTVETTANQDFHCCNKT